MQLFRSEEHLNRWYKGEGHERGAVLDLEKTWVLARSWYKDRLRPDFRGHSADQVTAIFQQVGLRGAFWETNPINP